MKLVSLFLTSFLSLFNLGTYLCAAPPAQEDVRVWIPSESIYHSFVSVESPRDIPPKEFLLDESAREREFEEEDVSHSKGFLHHFPSPPPLFGPTNHGSVQESLLSLGSLQHAHRSPLLRC
jgi:hypothetical protein